MCGVIGFSDGSYSPLLYINYSFFTLGTATTPCGEIVLDVRLNEGMVEEFHRAWREQVLDSVQ